MGATDGRSSEAHIGTTARSQRGGLRVLYVIDSLGDGGAEHSLAHMAPGFDEQGIDLHIAFLRDRWHCADALRAAGATLHPVELGRGRLRQGRALVRLIRGLGPDVVHTTLWESDVLGRLAAAATGTPAVSTFANSSYGPAQFADPSVSVAKLRAAQAIDFATERLVVRFHAVSEQVATDMLGRMHLPRERVAVVPRARRREVLGEPSPERRERARAALSIDVNRSMVLAVARHEHQKGLDVLVDAAAHLVRTGREVEVVVAGREGRATTALVEQITEAGLEDRVRLLGSRDDVPDLMVAADLVAVPTRIEGLPGVVLEAMALECPVVATELPAVVEAIGDFAAELVPMDDPTALADALERTLDSDLSDLTTAARRRFDDRFTPVGVARDLDVLYRTAIERSRWTRWRRAT